MAKKKNKPPSFEDLLEEEFGGGGDDGGGGGGTSTSSGGGGGGEDEGAARRRSFIGTLNELGLSAAAFADLLAAAVAGKWATGTFLFALARHKAFKKMFPGIGSLIAGLGKRGQFTVSQAIQAYRQMTESYREVAADLGLAGLARLTPRRIAVLIKNRVSPEEFKQRLLIFERVKSTDGTRQAFNQILNQAGQAKLDKKGWFKFLMGVADRKLYDLYEAVQIKSAGLDVSKGFAKGLAKNLGVSGALTDLSEFASSVAELRAEVAPELRAAGLGDEDLALAVLSIQGQQLGGDLAKRAFAAKQTLERIVRQRRALLEQRPRTQAQRGPGGRPVLPSAPQVPVQSA